MCATLLHQYQLVLSSRGALLNYCETIRPEHLAQAIPLYNNDCMGSLMRHEANTYLGWLFNFLQQEQRPYFTEDNHKNIQAIRGMFDEVNLMVTSFLQQYKDDINAPLTLPREGETVLTLTPLELFTHVITHEYHHKGQLANMSRQLGYIPVDTDVIRN
ncbi:DinB family protein [Mucilaginibacter sp. SG564]|uniref:DinB family protein n=1 Tax=Mucilaginibacter sp. SG564 TaxID=2587022 RepID=UPI001553DA03|nr:DinB family protein [Mucilaginibacter sp. SG564]NOW98599.1 putative damage-inducible protein DinB [Mucilaginibacter sp. SG564]